MLQKIKEILWISNWEKTTSMRNFFSVGVYNVPYFSLWLVKSCLQPSVPSPPSRQTHLSPHRTSDLNLCLWYHCPISTERNALLNLECKATGDLMHKLIGWKCSVWYYILWTHLVELHARKSFFSNYIKTAKLYSSEYNWKIMPINTRQSQKVTSSTCPGSLKHRQIYNTEAWI